MRPVAFWTPPPIWEGRPCYIIGGGPSLRGFPFSSLSGEFVLGCNMAYHLGVDIVPIVVFGDASFLQANREGLEAYAGAGGWVVTNSNHLKKSIPAWLRMTKKVLKGLSTDGLGWNGNTGASAINLALLLGADPVYLLGYDMGVDGQGRSNYHDRYRPTRVHPRTYPRFLHGMEAVARDLPRLFPGRHVINLEDGTSKLEVFPKQSLRTHMEQMEVAA